MSFLDKNISHSIFYFSPQNYEKYAKILVFFSAKLRKICENSCIFLRKTTKNMRKFLYLAIEYFRRKMIF